MRCRLAVAVAVGVLLAPVGCADDDDTAVTTRGTPTPAEGTRPEVEGAQPRIDAGPEFGEGAFDNLPLLPGSNQVGPISEIDGVVTGTYTVHGHTAETAIDEMTVLLTEAGFQQLIGPMEWPAGAIRTEWDVGGRRLEVVATDVTGMEGGHRMQYSLLLHADLDDAGAEAGRPPTG